MANAGVDVGGVDLSERASVGAMAGVIVGLVVGKPIGVIAASALTVRLGLAARPRGVTWGGVALVGLVAGIGFTMAIFVADLAFPPGPLLGAAKLAVLIASVVAGIVALVGGRFLLPKSQAPEIAEITCDAAESSTDF